MRDDRSHARQLLRDIAITNARIATELGPLPPGGLPVQHKRKPEPWRYTEDCTRAIETPAKADAMEDGMNMNQMALAAAIGVASVLSACGSDGATTQASREPAVVVTKEAAASDWASATTAATTDAQAAAAATTQSRKKSDPADLGPMIPAAELRRRILSLLESVKQPEEMSLANAQLKLGVTLIEKPDIPGYWELRGSTDLPLGYGFIVREEPTPEEGYPRIHLLVPGQANSTSQLTALCPYDLEEIARDIVALGYIRKPGWQDPNSHVLFKLETPKRDFAISVKVFKYTENPEAKRVNRRYCVENIIISAGVPFHE